MVFVKPCLAIMTNPATVGEGKMGEVRGLGPNGLGLSTRDTLDPDLGFAIRHGIHYTVPSGINTVNTVLTHQARPITAFDRGRVGSVALKSFFKLAAEWGLAADDQITLLGQPSRRTFYRWRAGDVAGLPADTLERVSVLLGIYKALAILLPVKERATSWVKRENAAFGGHTALDVMRQGRVDDLYQVRRHLDAWRGG